MFYNRGKLFCYSSINRWLTFFGVMALNFSRSSTSTHNALIIVSFYIVSDYQHFTHVESWVRNINCNRADEKANDVKFRRISSVKTWKWTSSSNLIRLDVEHECRNSRMENCCGTFFVSMMLFYQHHFGTSILCTKFKDSVPYSGTEINWIRLFVGFSSEKMESYKEKHFISALKLESICFGCCNRQFSITLNENSGVSEVKYLFWHILPKSRWFFHCVSIHTHFAYFDYSDNVGKRLFA